MCDKRFRSKGAYGDHERGKKHLDGVLRLIEEEGLDVDDLLSAGLRLESDDDDDDETVEAAEETAEETAEEKGGSTEGSTKEKKKKEKKEKKKRRASKGSKESKESSRETTTTPRCGGCGEGFGSRTKLFAHLRAFPGHATLRR